MLTLIGDTLLLYMSQCSQQDLLKVCRKEYMMLAGALGMPSRLFLWWWAHEYQMSMSHASTLWRASDEQAQIVEDSEDAASCFC